MEVEEDGIVESQAEQDAYELELTRVVEGIRIEPEEAGWGGREGGREER